MFDRFSVEVHGASSARPNHPDSWDNTIKHQRLRNRPLDASGQEMRFGEFQHMSEADLARWRDHIVDSFTEGSGSSHRLQFVTSSGDIPTLTILCQKSAPGS